MVFQAIGIKGLNALSNINNIKAAAAHGMSNIEYEESLAFARPDLIPAMCLDNAVSPYKVKPNSCIEVKWRCERGHTWLEPIKTKASRKSEGCPICKKQKNYAGQSKKPAPKMF